MQYEIVDFNNEYHIFWRDELNILRWWGSFGDSRERATRTVDILNRNA